MKIRLKVFTLIVLILCRCGAFAQAGKIMNADGRTDTYKLIESYGYGVEVPDCGHPIKHITQQFDNDLQKQVFAFTLHAELDDDRCGAQDRQRAEIKTFGPSPESMKGHQGKTHIYKWKFKLNSGFQPSPLFCHIHQVKADAGPNAGAPIVTLTPRLKDGKEVLLFNVVSPANASVTLAEVDLSSFKGVWVEVTEKILHDRQGAIEMEIKRVSDGKRLLFGKSDYVDLWRDGARFNRPKYGIYRSLKESSYLRNESVLFADIELIEVSDKNQVKRGLVGWEIPEQIQKERENFFLSRKTFNVIDFGAIGNNLHDNSSAFAKAIESCASFGGGTVWVPKGMYRLDIPLSLKSNVLLSLSNESILNFNSAIVDEFLINCNSQENTGLSGKGKIRGTGKGGVRISDSRNVWISADVESSGDNIFIQASKLCENIIITDSYFRNAQNNAFTIGGEASGRISNVFAENNTFGIIPKNLVYMGSDTNKGGTIEDIYMRNSCSEGYPCETAFRIEQNTGELPQKQTPVIWYSYFEDFSNINVKENGISFTSLSKNTHPVESMWFKNIQIIGAKEIVIKDQTRDIYIDNVSSKLFNLNDITSNAVSGANLDYKTNETPESWSVAAAQSLMARYPDFTQTYWNAWTYVHGYMACAFERLYKDTNDKRYLDYIKKYIDNFIDEDGDFLAVANNKGIARVPNVCDNLDNMMTGNTLVMLYEYYKDPCYKKAAEYIRNCLNDYPRNNDGGFWHSRGQTGQMWIDGIFMGQMFLLRYGRSIGDSEYAYDEAVRQIVAYSKTGEQGNSGLYVHGVYEPGHGERECRWVNSATGKSPEVWGEGLGWYALVMVEALETIPQNHKGYKEVKDIFLRLASALKRTQDSATGGWYQVVDKTDEPDNWIETSGTAMFTYAIQQGINLGILDKKEYEPVVKGGYNLIVNHAKINENGLVNVYEACDGVGVQENYDKYINYKRSLNAKEAYVGFVWATEIVERDAIKKNLK